MRTVEPTGRLAELVRYGAVGVINTGFGFGLYSLFVFVGLNVFAAQLLAHAIGMAFNFVMFKRHVFTESQASLARYIASYAVNYLISLGLLFVFHHLIASPYLVGFTVLICAAAINYLMLKLFVFRRLRQAR
jgi:putative flippase GtrA